jgi:hypothetical protein
MSTLTKEQIKQLTPEQQEALATISLRRVTKRERLLRQARGPQVYLGVQGGLLAAIVGVAGFSRLPVPLLICVSGVAVMVCVCIISAHRRIDALLELFDSDDDES